MSGLHKQGRQELMVTMFGDQKLQSAIILCFYKAVNSKYVQVLLYLRDCVDRYTIKPDNSIIIRTDKFRKALCLKKVFCLLVFIARPGSFTLSHQILVTLMTKF